MNNNIIIFTVFWGIWILLPVVFDGFKVLMETVTVLIWGRAFKKHQIPPEKLPLVTLIIPTYNEEANIHECLTNLKIQTYPHRLLEIIVVDNGSVDKTREIVLGHIANGSLTANRLPTTAQNNNKIQLHGEYFGQNEFAGMIDLVTRADKGKAEALNEGIGRSRGEIVITIDSRTFLAPQAIYNMVAKFIEEPKLVACTGNIEINWQMGQTKPLSMKESFLAKCQFLEYLAGFRIGRQFQDLTDSMYTLAGAFSGFRQNVLMTMYSSATVSEDTDLTLSLQRQKFHIGYAADAKAYLKPIMSWEKLYAQRVRWARGEMEVFGLYDKFAKRLRNGWGKAIFYPLLLISDHTFTFPRLIWTFLLPFMMLFGYSFYVIWMAILLMIGFYIVIDLFIICCSWLIVDADTRAQIRRSFHYFFLMWLYRFIVYFFRLSAYLIICKERSEWTVEKNPFKSIKRITQELRGGRQK